MWSTGRVILCVCYGGWKLERFRKVCACSSEKWRYLARELCAPVVDEAVNGPC